MSGRRRTSLALVALLAAAPLCAADAPSAPRSLYQRLGGYDAIAAVTDAFIGRLAGDADLGAFFKGHSEDSLKRVRQLIVDQLCAVTGGPCVYIGRDMKTAHKGMGISEANWSTMVRLFVATLDQFEVPAAEQTDLLAIVSTLKGDIVEKP